MAHELNTQRDYTFEFIDTEICGGGFEVGNCDLYFEDPDACLVVTVTECDWTDERQSTSVCVNDGDGNRIKVPDELFETPLIRDAVSRAQARSSAAAIIMREDDRHLD